MIRRGAPANLLSENGQTASVQKGLSLTHDGKAAATPRRVFGDLRNVGNHVTTPRPDGSMKKPPFPKSTSLKPKRMTFNVLDTAATENTSSKLKNTEGANPLPLSLPTQTPRQSTVSVNCKKEAAGAPNVKTLRQEDVVDNLEDWDEIPPVEEPFMGGNVELEPSDIVVEDVVLSNDCCEQTAYFLDNLIKEWAITKDDRIPDQMENESTLMSYNEEDVLAGLESIHDFHLEPTLSLENDYVNTSFCIHSSHQ